VVGGVGTAVGGGLALAGGLGIAGLALSNPIGWGLLGGAALVGGGVAAYKKYRKHQLGKQLDSDGSRAELKAAGIHVPTDQELKPTGFLEKMKNFITFSTASQRRHDAVRGHIAEKLAKNEDADRDEHQPGLAEIMRHLGIKEKPQAPPPNEQSPLSDQAAVEKRKTAQGKRAKSIARALEG
jgi:hypothetical protein